MIIIKKFSLNKLLKKFIYLLGEISTSINKEG